MPVQQVVQFKDNDGKMHPSMEQAKHANGLIALRKRLDKDCIYGKVEQDTILENFQEWYVTYLEGTNA